MSNPSMMLIETKTVGAGGAPSINFANIPQTFTDLMVVASIRNTGTYEHVLVGLNGSTSNFTGRYLSGYGSSGQTATGVYARYLGNTSRDGYTAGAFGSTSIYIPNYTSANPKSISAESVGENNDTSQWAVVASANLWNDTSAVTSVQLTNESGANLVQGSTASLYGISKDVNVAGAKATGGMMTSSGGYIYHAFYGSGTFTPLAPVTVDYLMVAGGGAGGSSGSNSPGGGGGGGFRAFTGQTISSPSAVVVGAGGARAYNSAGGDGSPSSFNGHSVSGGGGGASYGHGRPGGSGGGASSNSGNLGGAGNSGNYSPVEGYRGGNGGINGGGGAGGGAGGQGGDGYSGPVAGGPGASSYNGINVSGWLSATGSPSSLGYGGLGAITYLEHGAPNSGGGGGAGGGYISGGGGNGGSGLVIIRYAV